MVSPVLENLSWRSLLVSQNETNEITLMTEELEIIDDRDAESGNEIIQQCRREFFRLAVVGGLIVASVGSAMASF